MYKDAASNMQRLHGRECCLNHDPPHLRPAPDEVVQAQHSDHPPGTPINDRLQKLDQLLFEINVAVSEPNRRGMHAIIRVQLGQWI